MENTQTKQPKALWLLCIIEICERFSYYTMLSILILYLVYALKMETAGAAQFYGSVTALIYLSGIMGGYLADKFTGQKPAIIWGSVMIAAGLFVLGVEHLWAIYLAFFLLILGTGFFKVNISTLVGALYEKDDARRDGGFTYFYMAVNIGALFAALVGGGIGEKYGWKYGFWLAGVVMLAGLAAFVILKEKFLKDVGNKPLVRATKQDVKNTATGAVMVVAFCVLAWLLGVWAAGAVFAVGALALFIKDKIKKPAGVLAARQPLTLEEKQRIAVIFILAFFVIFFWTAFDQSGAALNLFAYEYTDRWFNFFGLFKWEIPATWFQSLNPLFVIIFAPFFSKLWISLAKKGKEPSTPGKFVWALWLLALGYVIMLISAMQMGPGIKVSMLYLVGAYAVFTLGELCLSPVGLSMVTKLAPAHLVGSMMGVWVLSNAVSNKLVGVYASLFEKISMEAFFGGLIAGPLAASLVLVALLPKLKKWMHGVH